MNFLLVAVALFLIVRAYNAMKRPEPVGDQADEPSEEIRLLREIRDGVRSGDSPWSPAPRARRVIRR